MILFKRACDINKYLRIKAQSGLTIGFVPTMGALHAGHISLIKESKIYCAITVASIFINPTQFNDPTDFAKYPVTLSADIQSLKESGCDVLFLPGIEEIYPNGTKKVSHYDVGYLETILEGKYRPGHFQGVCQVMHRLLEIITPTTLFLGQKDYQQCMVIKKLIASFNPSIEVKPVATLRESSGLAMSSRNLRLSDTDKEKAAIIYQSLQYLKLHIAAGDLTDLIDIARNMILEKGFDKIDYLSIANADSLQPATNWDGQEPMVALIAAYLNGVRLIDNMILHS